MSRSPAAGWRERQHRQATRQPPPFTVNAVGRPLVPVHVPTKPNVAEPPAGMRLFQSTLRAVTAAPDWVPVAFQIWLSCWPLGKLKPTVHSLTDDEPVFVILTSPWNPPAHWLTIVYLTAHVA